MPGRYRPSVAVRQLIREYQPTKRGSKPKVTSTLGRHIRGPRRRIVDALSSEKASFAKLHNLCLDEIISGLCGVLDADGAITSLREANLLLVAFEDNAIVAFAAATVVKSQILRLDLICSRGAGAGSALIGRLESWGKYLHSPAIVLEAVDTAIDFYRGLGYINSELPDCSELKEISALYNKLLHRHGKHPLKNTTAFSEFDQLLTDLELNHTQETDDPEEFPPVLYPMLKCLRKE